MKREKIVVIGNGMTSVKFLENLLDLGGGDRFEIVVFGEESWPAYDRIHLSDFFKGQSEDELLIKPSNWYEEQGIKLELNKKISLIDESRGVIELDGLEPVFFDRLVLATGSYAFVPPIAGLKREHYHLFRDLCDVQAIKKEAGENKKALVIGGGVLGLEAAKAIQDLGLDVHILERADSLMAMQLDAKAGALLLSEVKQAGFSVTLKGMIDRIESEAQQKHIHLEDGQKLTFDLVLISAGFRPRDELGKISGIPLGNRGGFAVDQTMQTAIPDIYAIGDCASLENRTYALVMPGYKMAETAARSILGLPLNTFSIFNSVKLKSLKIEVASFGEVNNPTEPFKELILENLASGIYKKLVISQDGKRLLGGILFGDCEQYFYLSQMAQLETPVPKVAETLLLPQIKDDTNPMALAFVSSNAVICGCENIKKKDIVKAIQEHDIKDINHLKSVTKAGTGCGGCVPVLRDILSLELEKSGLSIPKHLCEHFLFNRQELVIKIKSDQVKTFREALHKFGRGLGCEICKPAIASILASLWNEPVLNQPWIQDGNDTFLANIQKDGSYSVIPRIPAGVTSAEQLLKLGAVAADYNLSVKITGGQRIGLYGAQLEQLPAIWKELTDFGFESGYAYGKSLRTVKSCVGSTWCPYGVQDSLSLAARLENRYKGLRSPHKLKGGVSGCSRECAEAMSKDFGVIASDKGWNLYVGGNGGVRPKQAKLLLQDATEKEIISCLDRFFMYYIQTADPLMRTAHWIEQFPEGLKHLKEVILEDSLNQGEQWETEIAEILSNYQCEWKNTLEDPVKLKRFQTCIYST